MEQTSSNFNNNERTLVFLLAIAFILSAVFTVYAGVEAVQAIFDSVNAPRPDPKMPGTIPIQAGEQPQPQHPTPTPSILLATATPNGPAAAVTAPKSMPNPFQFHGIDFQKMDQEITIQLLPRDAGLNNGDMIRMSFLPGEECHFGDHRACVGTYLDGWATFLTIHSGQGGEGQALRNALEGTSLDQAAYSLDTIYTNLSLLAGSEVMISQGETSVQGLKVGAVVRVPAEAIENYFNLPVEDALFWAASRSPEMLAALQSPAPKILFETCGWKQSEEPWTPGVTATTASVYLGVIVTR